MPRRPDKPCAYPGCPKLIPANMKYCEEHTPTKPKGTPDKRPSRIGGSLYSTARWKRLRKMVLDQEPFCRECAAQGRAVFAEDVDHIVDHGGDYNLFWDMDNLQPLCHSCHSKKTAAERRGKLKTYTY